MRTHRTWPFAILTVGLLGIGSALAQEQAPAPKEKPESAQPQTGSVMVMEQPPLSSRWFVRGEWVYLQRDTPRLLVAVQQVTTPPPTRFFDEDVNIHDLIHFNNEHGLRVTAGQVNELGGGVEISYLGLHEWDESASLVPTRPNGINARTALLNVFPFNNPAVYDFAYSSELHSLEVNAREGVWARESIRLALLAGVRYVKVDEDFLWTATALNGTVGVYTSSTENDLYGLQIGGELQLDLAPGLAVVGVTKAGVFVNFSEQASAIVAPGGTATGSGEDETVAAALELGASLQYQLGSNVRLGVGYQALFLYGLALAPRQLKAATPNFQDGLNYGGSSVYHGPTASVEITW